MEKFKLLSPPKYTSLLLPPKLMPCFSAFAAGMLLSGARILHTPLPAAVCLIAVLRGELSAGFCYLGTAIGCLLFWNLNTVLLTLTAGFLTMAMGWALQDLPIGQHRLFPLLTATVPGLLAGTMILLSGPITGKTAVSFVLQMLFLPVGAWAAEMILHKPTGTPICLALFALTSGSGRLLLPGGLPLGGILASGAVFSLTGTSLALPAAALAGLALDWSWGNATSCVAVLTIAALSATYLPAKKRSTRLLAFLLSAGLVLILSGGKGGQLFLSAMIGGGISLLFPPLPVDEPSLSPTDTARQRLHRAALAMETLYRQLEDLPDLSSRCCVTDIYDHATAKICTTCAGFSTCWKQNGTETCNIFLEAAPKFFARGSARAEDFSEEFQKSCRHMPKLLESITFALHQDAQRRQKTNFRREIRAVISGQYRILSDFLRLNVLPLRPQKEPNFSVDTACLVQGRKGASVSGDRCTGFQVGHRQYLLLCDGMGTGVEAAVSSRRAMELLTDLLKSGMEPDNALETLGALTIFREDGGFCAVDLACVSLVTGDGTLYKWGGGPSYVKDGDTVKKIGTATLPPGLGVGGTHQAKQIKLSLGRGEVLILTSDGVDGEDAQRLIRAANGLKAEDLAAGILQAGISEGEDDRSAAVLMLHPSSTR